VENGILKKKLEDSEATLANLRESYTQQESELLLSGERIVLLETQLADNSSKAQSRIQELETELAAANAKSERLLTNYSTL
jgi:predicted  nucleic acid-binding Zn-ribbon protein